eukprot:2595598-Amphidinium_carterae.1
MELLNSVARPSSTVVTCKSRLTQGMGFPHGCARLHHRSHALANTLQLISEVRCCPIVNEL